MLRGLFKTGILHVTWRFASEAIIPRAPEIVYTQDSLIAIILGIAAGFESAHIFLHSAKLSDLAVGFIGYAAIALGFCVGGITIALTLPDKDFVVRLATLNIETKEGDALSSLLFVFCWTAFVHWCSLVLALLFLLTFGHIEASELVNAGLWPRILLGGAVAVAAYTLMQFLITTLTIWQVGRSYICKIKRDAANLPTSATK